MIFELALGGKIRDKKRKQRGVCLGPIGLIVAPWKSNVFKTRTSHFCGATISLWFLDRNIHFRTLLCIKLQALDERNCEVEFSTSERGHFGTRVVINCFNNFEFGKPRNREYHPVSLLGKIIIPLFLNVRPKIPRKVKSRYFVNDLQLQTKQTKMLR